MHLICLNSVQQLLNLSGVLIILDYEIDYALVFACKEHALFCTKMYENSDTRMLYYIYVYYIFVCTYMNVCLAVRGVKVSSREQYARTCSTLVVMRKFVRLIKDRGTDVNTVVT